MKMLERLVPRVQAANKRIVLPEGHDPRVILAAVKAKRNRLATPIVLATPDELAATAPALIKAGARIVGGCCGTSLEHYRKLAAAIRPKKTK